MTPNRHDFDAWRARESRHAPRWAAPWNNCEHAADCVDLAINKRAGLPNRREWGNAVALLRLVRSNQARGIRSTEYPGFDNTLRGYIASAVYRGGDISGRRNQFRRLLRRLAA